MNIFKYLKPLNLMANTRFKWVMGIMMDYFDLGLFFDVRKH